MEVLSTSHGSTRRYRYYCYTARRKGSAVCSNKLPADMATTDAAVLRSVEDTLLHPAVLKRALTHAEGLILNDRTEEQQSGWDFLRGDPDCRPGRGVLGSSDRTSVLGRLQTLAT